MARSSAVIVAASLLCTFASAEVVTAAARTEVESLEEVVVEGSRNELNRLRDQAIQFEEQFFTRFNELNPIDDFDTHCYREARVGTKLKRRYCRAVYQDKAYMTEGQDYANARFMEEGSTPPQPMAPPTPAYVAIQGRMEEYRNHMRELVKKHPELIELLRKRFEAEKQYDAARRRIFGLSPAKSESPAP